MSTFDPYHRWLGISPAEQPPHHYRLLGLTLFESDPDIIVSAADRQMAHLQTFRTGAQSGLTQQILNEVAAAKLLLLNPAKKAAYDAHLRQQLPPAALSSLSLALPPNPPPVHAASPLRQDPAPMAEPAEEVSEFEFEESVSSRRPPARPTNYAVPLAAGIVVAIGLLGVIGFVLVSPPAKPLANAQLTETTEKQRSTPIATADAAPSTPAAIPSRSIPEPTPSTTALMMPVQPEPSPPLAPTSLVPATTAKVEVTPAAPLNNPAPLVATEPKAADAQVLETVDLLALINPERDNARPGWKREGKELVSSDKEADGSYVNIPYRVPLDYRLRMEINWETVGRHYFIAMSLVGGLDGTHVPVILHDPVGRGIYSGFEMLDGKRWNENESTVTGNVLPRNAWTEIVYTVRPAFAEVVVAGRPLLTWKKSFERFAGMHPNDYRRAPLIRPDQLILWVGASQYRVRNLTLEKLAPLPGFPVPTGADLAEATTLIASTIEPKVNDAKDAAARDHELKEALKTALATEPGSAGQFALLSGIRQWSIAAGNVPVALSATDALARFTGSDPLTRRIETLREIGDRVPKGDHLYLVTKSVGALLMAADEERYDDASEMLRIAKEAARKGPRPMFLDDWFETWNTRLSRMKKGQTEVADARSHANDSAAALAIGKYQLLVREDFDQGLPLLAKCSDPTWQELATADLENPSDGKAAYDLGERWRKLAGDLSQEDRPALMHRASEWYRTSLAALDPLRKQSALQALDKIGIYNLRRDARDRTYTYRGKRLSCITSSATWTEADKWTRERGGRLVCIRDLPENTQVLKLVGEAMKAGDTSGDAWLGGTDEGAEGDWRWVDGSRFGFKNWLKDQPDNTHKNEHRLKIFLRPKADQHGKWNDVPDNLQQWFVVQWQMD